MRKILFATVMGVVTIGLWVPSILSLGALLLAGRRAGR